MTLGLRIRSLRNSTKLTQKMLAEKLKIPNQNLSNYERGFRQPDYETLEKIADFFEVSTDYLLGRTDKKEKIPDAMLGKKISELRKNKKLSQYELADCLGFSRGKLDNYEQGSREPDYETLKKIADFFEVSTDYLLDRTLNKEVNSNNLPELAKQEERDIARDLEKTLEELDNSEEVFMFDGEPLDEHTKEMIRIALENSMRMAKQLAKQKSTPNEYKK